MFWRRISIDVPGDDHGMIHHLFVSESRVGPINQKAFSHPDAGEHSGDEVGVVLVVVIGIGEHIDQDVGRFQGLPGIFQFLMHSLQFCPFSLCQFAF